MTLSTNFNLHETKSFFTSIIKADEEFSEAKDRIWKESHECLDSEELDARLRDEAERITANYEERLEGQDFDEGLSLTGQIYDYVKINLEDSIPDSVKSNLEW